MRGELLIKLAGQLKDFMSDVYGDVRFDGQGTWTASDGGATFKITKLSPVEAMCLDHIARSKVS